MLFKFDDTGVLIRVSSNEELLGSIKKDELHFLDFVMIDRPPRDRSPKYGIYIGTLSDCCLVRTHRGDEAVERDAIIPIIPSQSLFATLKNIFNNYLALNTYNPILSFYISYVKMKYPQEFEDVNIQCCERCGSHHVSQRFEGHTYCENCYHSMVVYCDMCGERTLAENTIDGECVTCHKRLRVLPYHSQQPKLKFHGDTHENTVPFLGVELEVAYGGQSDSNVAKILPLINEDDDIFMYCSRDGSLTQGFENITQPATLDYHQSIKEKYIAVFNKLRELGYGSHDTTCCGFHIHANRDFFNGSAIPVHRLCDIISAFWDEIFLFSRRRKESINQYAKLWWNDMPNNTYIERYNMSENHNARYYALNIANNETIEFRMFRGTLNIDTFFATLELVNNMMIIAKTKSSTEIQNMRFEDFLTTDESKTYWNRVQMLTNEL